MDWAGRRVTIMGLGRHGGGLGAARFLSARGAVVTVTDQASEQSLAESIAALDDLPIARWRLGGHDEDDFLAADAIVVNPAVKPDHPLLALAESAGVPLTSEIELFLERCPARVAAVTGSNGKSSTAAMLASILEAAGHRVWLGGNIGRSLLDDLPRIEPEDDVVLEVSSFQLVRMTGRLRPFQLAVVTNCAPNHLDWHGNYDAYRQAKQRLLDLQPADSLAVLDDQDGELAGWTELVRGRLVRPWPDHDLPELKVRGAHQRKNAQLAAAAASAWGPDSGTVQQGLGNFSGLPHRLQQVATIAGRAFYNDSLATTPESTSAALDAFDGRVWLLAGGSDKGTDFAQLGAKIAARAAGAAFFGATGDRLLAEAERAGAGQRCTRVATLRDALAWCWDRSRSGESIVLSPACASYDQFRDYADRAEYFCDCIRALPAAAGQGEREALRG